MAPLEKLSSSLKGSDRMTGRIESRSKMLLQLLEPDPGHVLVIPLRVGQAEAFTKLLPTHGRFAVLCQHLIGGGKRGSRVIHERAGPVENQCAEHGSFKVGDFECVMGRRNGAQPVL